MRQKKLSLLAFPKFINKVSISIFAIRGKSTAGSSCH